MNQENVQTVNMIKEIINRNVKEEKERLYDANIIGSEIKIKRSKMRVTLKALTSNICSVSYLSKIEHNQIKANHYVLKEICKRLEITKEQLSEMLNSGGTFKELLKAYFENDIDKINLIYEKVKDLRNYRAQIIKCYYFLAHNQLVEFDKICKTILPSLNTLNIYDSNHYCLALMIYYYKTDRIAECATAINSLSNVFSNDIESLILQEYCIYISNRIHSLFSLKLIDDFKDECSKYNYLNKIVDIENLRKQYIACSSFDILWKKFPLFESFENDEIKNMLNKNYNETNVEFYQILLAYKNDKNEFINKYNKDFKYQNIFDYYVVQYLNLKETHYDNAISFLLENCLVRAFNSNDYLYALYFTKELEKHYIINAKYKRYYEVESKFNQIFSDINNKFSFKFRGRENEIN